MTSAITWFEIPTKRLEQAQAFYEAGPGVTMRREAMAPSQAAVFPYDKAAGATSGALVMGPTAPKLGSRGSQVYLNANPSLDAALARVAPAGWHVALPRQALPPGMGFFAHITDLDSNRVGLHALA